MIELKDVFKTYSVGEREVPILKGVSLRVEQGEFISIMGPSGSGKSTLISILGCLDRMSAGVYRLAGRDVSALSPDELAAVRNAQIGFVFQNFNLLPYYDALANVELPLVYSGGAKDPTRPRRLLERVGLGHRLHHRPGALSGGEKQRVAIARALVNEPRLIIADEPTGNLDSKTGREILELFEDLRASGATVVLVTHDPAVAERGDRVVRIKDGLLE